MKESLEEDETSLYDDDEEGYLIENGQHKRLNLKMKVIFQILFYQAAHGRKNTSLHILNARAIYEHCHSRELITAFNRQGCSANYKTMKNMRAVVAKYAILMSKDVHVPLPSHFSKFLFTIAAVDNFDYTDRNSLSGTKHSHDTAITVFQEKPLTSVCKPKKSDVELKSIKKLQKLKCQEVVFFSSNSPKLPLPDSFTSPKDLVNLETKAAERNQKHFVISCAQNITKIDWKYLIPSWAGIELLISESDVPIMQVRFLPFIPRPVTDYSTVYNVMLNMTTLVNQLDQNILPGYCDEGVFRTVIDIYLQRRKQFQNLIPMLGNFHTAKCFEHCIDKYIDKAGIDDFLSQTKVVGVKTLKSVVEGTNYTRSLKAIVILAHAIKSLKWEAFINNGDMSKYGDFLSSKEDFQKPLSKKDCRSSKSL